MALGQGKHPRGSEALPEGSRQVGSRGPEQLLQWWLLLSDPGSVQLTEGPSG